MPTSRELVVVGRAQLEGRAQLGGSEPVTLTMTDVVAQLQADVTHAHTDSRDRAENIKKISSFIIIS